MKIKQKYEKKLLKATKDQKTKLRINKNQSKTIGKTISFFWKIFRNLIKLIDKLMKKNKNEQNIWIGMGPANASY